MRINSDQAKERTAKTKKLEMAAEWKETTELLNEYKIIQNINQGERPRGPTRRNERMKESEGESARRKEVILNAGRLLNILEIYKGIISFFIPISLTFSRVAPAQIYFIRSLLSRNIIFGAIQLMLLLYFLLLQFNTTDREKKKTESKKILSSCKQRATNQ